MASQSGIISYMDDKRLPQQNSPSATPVSPVAKEHAPLPSVVASEWIAPSTQEISVPQELQEHMEASVVPTLSDSAQDAGVRYAKDATPVTMTEDEPLGLTTPPSVLVRIKQAHKSVQDAVRWLTELVGLAQKKRDYEISHHSNSVKGGQA